MGRRGDEIAGDAPAEELAGEAWEEGEPFVVPIEESIDLHHFRPKEILEVVDAYLDAALERGYREVRLIHGRGTGFQRARMRKFLEGDARILRLEDAPPVRGGWGATLAWLRAPTDAGTESE